MPQIEKPDDSQSIANLIRFFCVCRMIAFHDENNQKYFGALIYQALHLAKSLPFTDKCSKTRFLSVNLNEIWDRLVEQYCCLKK